MQILEDAGWVKSNIEGQFDYKEDDMHMQIIPLWVWNFQKCTGELTHYMLTSSASDSEGLLVNFTNYLKLNFTLMDLTEAMNKIKYLCSLVSGRESLQDFKTVKALGDAGYLTEDQKTWLRDLAGLGD